MSRPAHLFAFCSLVALAWLGAAAQTPASRPPNIVFILADDIGYGDLGCYGATKVRTPHLDSLAARGLRFTDAYAPASVCTPTRYAILTGDYAWRSRAGRAVLNGDAALCIDPDKFTLPDLLKKAGYQTACVGKWHLGFGKERTDYNGDLKPGPLELGFDYFYGIPATGDRVPSVMVENHRVVGLDPADPIRIDYQKKIGDEPTGTERPDLLKLTADRQHSGTIVNGISRIGFMTGGRAARWKDEDIAATLAQKAIGFIERSQAQPFFLYLATQDIHAPRYPHPQFMKDSQLGTRGGAIAQLDWTVGEVLAALKRLSLEENTLVIFSSDNGGATDDGYADADLTGHRYNGALRGIKSGLWEGGSRVPFIVRWPVAVKPGQTTARIVTQLDLFATAAELTGQKIPAGVAGDSLSFLPVLQNRPGAPGRTAVVLQSGNARLALRDGDWKYIPDLKVVEGWYAARAKPLSGEGLFNLATDLGEQTNVAAAHPEIVTALRAQLAATASARPASYLTGVTAQLSLDWPKNRSVNIVCHGHSVPAGYFRTPEVRPLDAYPHLLRIGLAERFPHSVFNVIVTAIGGENSEQGAARFDHDVLSLRPDVVTIDYGLNDRAIGLARAEAAWRAMIVACQAKRIPVILLTPTADLKANLADPQDPLNQHAVLIRRLAAEYQVGLVDSLARFPADASDLNQLMAQNNHPNRRGHELVAVALLQWFPSPNASP